MSQRGASGANSQHNIKPGDYAAFERSGKIFEGRVDKITPANKAILLDQEGVEQEVALSHLVRDPDRSPPETLTHGKQPEEVLQEEAADHIQCERERFAALMNRA